MKVGFISDVHGNLVALDAVLDDMPDVDALVCCGDIIGYGPWPGECLERVRETCDVIVKGNHDRVVGDHSHYRANEMAFQGLEFAADSLTADQLAWLHSLPETTEAFDGRALVVHSHPEVTDQYVKPGGFTSVSTYMDDDHAVLALGHTHIQHAVDMSKFGRHGIVLNPGSVGQPRDHDPRAAYAVVDLDTGDYDLRRVEYDIEAVQEQIAACGLPTDTGKRLERGK